MEDKPGESVNRDHVKDKLILIAWTFLNKGNKLNSNK
jgi:hypothetical protein